MTPGSDEPSLDDLRRETESGDRIADTAPEQDFIDALELQFSDDDTPNSKKNITTNDPDLWDVFQVLEAHDERYAEFLENVGVTETDPARSVVVSRLVRHAIREMDPQLKEEIDEAKQRVDSGF